MAINKEEYINVLTGSQILNFFSWDRDLIDSFNDLRVMYLNYCKKCYEHFLYPKLDINTEIKPLLIELIKFAKSINVDVEYNQITKFTHEHGEYCKFYYKGYGINEIIDLHPGMKKFKYK